MAVRWRSVAGGQPIVFKIFSGVDGHPATPPYSIFFEIFARSGGKKTMMAIIAIIDVFPPERLKISQKIENSIFGVSTFDLFLLAID